MGSGMRIAKVFFAVVPILLCLLLQVRPVDAAQRQLHGLIVKLKPGLSSAEQAKVLTALGGTKKGRLQRLKLDVVNLPPGELEKAYARFKADPRVESVEVDHLRSAAGVPNDSSYSTQWALPKIGWDRVFGVTNPTGSATVAILDAGIDASHPDLAGKVIAGTSILDRGSDGRTDATGHGTMLAGIIAAVTDNGAGIAGVAPAGVKVMPVTVLDAAGTGLDSNIIEGITWAADHGADVILMPFSNPTFSQALQDAVDYAWGKGAVLIAATGNGGSTSPTFPAGDRGVVGVAATTQDNTLYSGSNRGPDTFVVAPGVEIYSTTRGGSYGEITGTSASAAVVAGIASYMKAVDPTLTNGLIVSRMGQSADQTEAGLPGYGIVNFADALDSVYMTPQQPAGVGSGEPFQDPYVASGDCDKLLFRSPQQNLLVGNMSGAIEIAASNGNFRCTLVAGNNVVTLSSTSGNYKFYSDASGTTEINSVVLVQGQKFDETNNTTHDAVIYYKDMNAGSPTITGVLSGLTTATQSLRVDPAPQTITFTSPAPASPQVDGPTYIPTASGGASGNPVVFTIAPASTSVCTIASGVVSFRSVGTCVINANQAGNANYLVAPQVQQSFTVGKGNQAAVTATVNPSTVVFGNTAALSASGGSGSGLYSFSAGDSTGCSVSGSTLNVTNASGDCSVTATKAADTNYLAATSAAVPVTLVKASQATVYVTAPASATFGQSGVTISGSGGSGTGAFSYSANGSDACSVDAVSGALTILTATGNCTVSATRLADHNYDPATSLSATVTLLKAAQSAVSVTLPASAYFGEKEVYAVAEGGNGIGLYRYSATGDACQIDSSTGLITISAGSGNCSISAARGGDDDYVDSNLSAAASLAITKAPQAQLNVIVTPSSLTYGESATLTTSGGNGGGLDTFSATGGCEIVSDTTLRVTDASGTCSVSASKAADPNYLAASSAQVSVTLAKAEQSAVIVSLPASAYYGQTGLFAAASGGSSSVAGYLYSASGACSVDSSTGALSFSTTVGSCTVSAEKPEDRNYNAASGTATMTVNKAAQPTLYAVVNPSTLTYGSSATVSSDGGAGDGAVSFEATGTGCKLEGSTLSVLNASGTCSVTARKAWDATYEAAASQPATVTLNKAEQGLVSVSGPGSAYYGQSGLSATASGGSGTGSYRYSATGACSVASDGALAFDATGNCSVTATRSEDDNFQASAVSPAFVIAVSQASQSTLAVLAPSTLTYGTSATLTTSGGNGGGLVTFSATGGCEIVSDTTLRVTDASGTCSVSASKAADPNYLAASSAPVSVTLAKAEQSAVIVSLPASAYYGQTGLFAAASGGSSSVAGYLYSASGACTVDSSTGALSFSTTVGSCTVSAEKPEDRNYNAASGTAAMNVNKAAQPPFTLAVTPSTLSYGATAAVSTSGGAGGGEVNYQVSGSGCKVVDSTLSVLDASQGCSVTATKASDANYEPATSNSVTVTLQQAAQQEFSVNAPASAYFSQQNVLATAFGGSGSGAVSYSATGSTACSVNADSGAVSVTSGTGNCVITATKAADKNYSSASAQATITINKAAQLTLTAIVTPSSVPYGTTAALSYAGGSGGAASFSATGNGCSVSGSTLSVLSAGGSCSVTARREGNDNYLPATSAATEVTLAKGTQQAVTVEAPISAILGEEGLFARASGGSGTGDYRYDSAGSTACSVNTLDGALTIAKTTGSCSITAIKLGDTNYNDSARSAAAVIAVGKADQEPLILLVDRTVAYGTTATLGTSGGSGSGGVTYRATGAGCSVSGNVLSVLAAGGSCSLTADKAGDDLYKPATSDPVSVVLVKGTQAQVTVSVPATARYQQAGLFAVASGGDEGGYSYAATGACSVNLSSGALSINAPSGSCSVTATRAGGSNYNPATSAAATVTALKGLQKSLVASATPSTVAYGSTATLSASGGDGTGDISFDAGSSTGCTVSGTTLRVTNASGICSITATKEGGTTWEPVTSPALTVALAKAPQDPVTLTGPASARLYQSGLAVAASGGSTLGAVSYSSVDATVCSVDASSGALDILVPSGICSITASKAGDDNYADATSAPFDIPVQKALQAPLRAVVNPSSVTYGETASLSSSGGNGLGDVSFDAGNSTGCRIDNGTTLAVTNASGSCSVSARKLGDTQYEDAVSQPETVPLKKAPQETVTVSAPAAARYNQTGVSATAGGGSGTGGYSYSVGSSDACLVDASTGAVSITSGTGTCSITATRTTDDNFLPSGVSAPASITISRADQNPLELSAPATLAYGSSATLSVTGGSTSSALTYSVGDSTGCKVVGATLSVTNVGGTCSVTATRGADRNYNETVSAAVQVALAQGQQSAVTVAVPPSATYNQPNLFARASGGDGTGEYSYSAGLSTACSVDPSSGAISITAATGVCSITASREGDLNYLPSAKSDEATIAVAKAAQPTLAVVVTPAVVPYGSTADLSTLGGAGTGGVTFSVLSASTGCELSSARSLRVTDPAGSCLVTATMAGDDNYLAATSAPKTVNLIQGTQAAVLVALPETATFGDTGLKAVASGGSGDGAYSYSAAGSDACEVDADGNITITSGTGNCVITATRAGNHYYFPSAASSPGSVPVAKAQQTITFASLDKKTYGAAEFSVAASASSELPVSYSSGNSAVATVTPEGMVKVVGQGTAVITASQAGDLNYAAAAAVQQTLTVEKAVLTVKANDASRSYRATDPEFSATFTGFVNDDSVAVVRGEAAFSTDAETDSKVGSYLITPALGSLEADNYSFTFQQGVLAIGLATQTITFNPLQPKSYGAGSFELQFTPGASENPVTFSSSDESVATVSGNTVTVKNAGSTVIIARQAGTTNYAEAIAQQTLTVDKAQLFVTAENKERPYNSANPTFTYKLGGFVNGDTSSAVTGAPDLSTDADLSSPVGNYDITVAPGTLDSANYSFTLVNGVLAVGKASQTITFDALPSKTYGDLSFTLSAQGGPSGNAVTFASSNSAIATVSGNTVNIVGAGDVTITANQAGNTNYAPASAQQPLKVAKAPLTVRANNASRRYNSANPTFSVSYDGFVRDETANTPGVLAGAPSVTTEAKPDSVPGSNYLIVPAVGTLFSTKYDFSYQNGTLTITKGLQEKVTVTAPQSAAYAQAGVAVAAGGGSGTGSYSYQTVNSNACSFLQPGAILTITSGTGTCAVSAIRAGDDFYEESAASVPVSITITRANQSALSVNAPATLTYGSSATLTGSGGNGTGSITFSSGSSTGCQVSGNSLTVTNASGNCSVSAVKAADLNYNSATSAAATVTLQRAGQGAVTVSVPAKAVYGQQGLLAAGGGGSGTGAYSYSAGSSTACSVHPSSGAITVLSGTGTCAITASRAGDNNHTLSAVSAAATVSIEKANQAVLTATAPASLVYGANATLSANGGSSSGKLTFSTGNSTGCAVSGNTLSVTDAGGNCSVTATREGDNNYYETTSAPRTVTLARAVPVISWSNPKTIVVGTPLSATQLNATANVAGGSFLYTPPAGTLLQIGPGQVLTVTYTPSDTRNYAPATKSVYINIDSATKPIAIDGPPTGSYANSKKGSRFVVTRTQPGSGAATSFGSTTSTTFTDSTALKPNTIYQYSVASDTDPTQTVFMTVRTPLALGWNIIAVPYDTTGVQPASFFADRVSTLYQWVSTSAPVSESSNTYHGSYVPVNTLEPGQGYFAKTMTKSTMLTYSGEEAPTSTTVTLKPGWNMIANPSLDNKTNIGQRWLIDDIIPLDVLINAGKIGGSVYWWNGVTYESWSIMQNNPQIEPWKGYWILNLDSVPHRLTIN